MVELATINSIGKNRSGRIEKETLQSELDKYAGKGTTNVTYEGTFLVKFIETTRMYEVDDNGDITYWGIEEELLGKAIITASPPSNTTPKLTQEVEIGIKTPVSIEDTKINLLYAWNKDKNSKPEDSNYITTTLSNGERERKGNCVSTDTEEGAYYLWVKVILNEKEIIKCFGPYAIKDHETLIECANEKESTSSFLGNTEIQRNQIEKVTIATSKGSHTLNDTNCWDVSQKQNGKYIAWYEKNTGNDYYSVTIAGDGGVTANSNSSYLFSYIGYNGEDNKVIYGIENLDTGLVTNMSHMFSNCVNMNEINLERFKTENVCSMNRTFYGCKNLVKLDLNNFDTSKVTSLYGTFENCESLRELKIEDWDTQNVTTMGEGNIGISAGGTFRGCKSLRELNLSKWDTRNVLCMARTFENCTSLEYVDISSFNTENVKQIWFMFAGCEKLTKLDASKIQFKKANNLREMFRDCKKLEELDVSNWNMENIQYLSGLFERCSSLQTLDVSKWNTTNFNDLSCIFDGCSSLKELDISNWNVEKTNNLSWTFSGCSNLEKLDFSKWKAENLTNMYWTFSNCKKITQLDLQGFNTSKVTKMQGIFSNCSSLEKLNIINWSVNKAEDTKHMFRSNSNNSGNNY